MTLVILALKLLAAIVGVLVFGACLLVALTAIGARALADDEASDAMPWTAVDGDDDDA